jgi:hypothetical protein
MVNSICLTIAAYSTADPKAKAQFSGAMLTACILSYSVTHCVSFQYMTTFEFYMACAGRDGECEGPRKARARAPPHGSGKRGARPEDSAVCTRTRCGSRRTCCVCCRTR